MDFASWDRGLRSDELAHFGTKGMKWGQRRFQNEDGSLTTLGKERYGSRGHRSAWGTKHDLNKLDREQTTAKARYDYYKGKADRGMARAQKRLKKAQMLNDNVKAEKAKAKMNKIREGVGQKAKDYGKLYERSKNLSESIIKKSLKKGYSVHSRDFERSVNKSRNIALTALGSVATAGTLLATGGVAAPAFIARQTATGKHYRVRNNGLGTRTHRSRKNRHLVGAVTAAVPTPRISYYR